MKNHTQHKGMRHRCAFLIQACVLTMALPLAHAQNDARPELSVSAADKKNATRPYLGLSEHNLDNMTDKHLDGVRGASFYGRVEPPPYSSRIADASLDAVNYFACRAAVFGAYRLVQEKSFVGDAGILVFTKRRFKLIDDWTARSGKSPAQVDVVMKGGETTWKGERVRIVNLWADYKLGRSYVLVLGDKDDADRTAFYTDPQFMEIDANTIYSGEGWHLFETGTSIAEAKSRIKKAVSLARCAQ